MSAATVHIVGAGIAGLSAATRFAESGSHVRLYESAGHAGGRCRSFYDASLGCTIDNGNHLILNGNRSVKTYAARVGASHLLTALPRASFPFADRSTGEHWQFDLGSGMGVWRTLLHLVWRGHGIPGCSRQALLSALRFRGGLPDASVEERLRNVGTIYQHLWEPLSLAILNTEPSEAMASAMWPVLQETLGKGGADACRPVLAPEGLGTALVDPALTYLERRGGQVCLNNALKALDHDGHVVTSLKFAKGVVDVEPGDLVVLATPLAALDELLPGTRRPTEYRAIVNVHFVLPNDAGRELTFIGLINAESHWIFVRDRIASVTVSAANSLVEETADQIADLLWPDVAFALGLSGTDKGTFRVIKEKRATFAQTPEQNRLRPPMKTGYNNLFLAGDYTDTGLPATLEGAISSSDIVFNSVIKTIK